MITSPPMDKTRAPSLPVGFVGRSQFADAQVVSF
jgi:hypothetical protein